VTGGFIVGRNASYVACFELTSETTLVVLRIAERRNCAGGEPNWRLNTRLNADSDS
jgi:hypothetical protein